MSDEKIVGIGGKKPASPKKKGKQRIPNNHPVLAFFARLEEKVDRHEILSVRSTKDFIGDSESWEVVLMSYLLPLTECRAFLIAFLQDEMPSIEDYVTNFSSEFCDPLEVLNEEEDQVEIDEQEFALLVQIELGGIFEID